MRLLFKKVKENILNFDSIEVIQFNYDGNGTALLLADGDPTPLGEPDLSETLLNSVYYKFEQRQ